MKVLMFLANPFTHDARVYNEAISLLKADHEVTVIAWDRQGQNSQKQNWDGILVVRVRGRQPRRPHRCPLLTALNLILWPWQAYRQALILNKETRFDVIHCHDLNTLAIGTRLKRKLGLPLVYDAHEIYGYTMTRIFPGWIASMFSWRERRLMRRVNRVITVSDALKRYFETATDKPISVVMNCKRLQNIEYQPAHNEGKFILLYIGRLHQVRGGLMLVQAVKELSGVRCLIGGMGHPRYVRALKEECSRTSNVAFLGVVPFDEVIPMTMKSDAVFCMFDPADPNSFVGTPNKLFEAMVCGRPIICTKGTYSGELTEQEEVGLAVEYSEQALREAIIRLRDDPQLREGLGRNALKAAISKYNWENQQEKLLDVYQGLLTGDE